MVSFYRVISCVNRGCEVDAAFSLGTLCCDYLRQDGYSEGLVAVFAHQVQGDDGEDVPGRRAGLPTHQLLPQPEPRGKLLRLQSKVRGTVHFSQLQPGVRWLLLVRYMRLLTEEAASIALTAAWKTFLGRRRLVVPLSTMLLS